MTRRRSAHHFCQGVVLVLLSFVLVHPAYALEWSRTELHLQYGNLAVPTFAGGGEFGTFYLYAATCQWLDIRGHLFFRRRTRCPESGVSGFRCLWRVVLELQSWQDHGSEGWRRDRFGRRCDSRLQRGSRGQDKKVPSRPAAVLGP